MRAVHVVNRVVAVVLGLVVVALGTAAVLWWTGTWDTVTGRELEDLGAVVDLDRAASTTELTWWAWAASGAGLTFVLVALWWAVVAARRPHPRRLRLPGPAAGGGLAVRTAAVVDELDRRSTALDGVSRSRSVVLDERGLAVLDQTLWVDPEADLAVVGAASDRLLREAGAVLGRSELEVRAWVAVTRQARTRRPRVR